MSIPIFGAVEKVTDLIGRIADKIWPDPAERAKAEVLIRSAEVQAEVQRTASELSAIIAEAQSPDPWTSRARPTFLYVMYMMILAALPFAVLWAFYPQTAERMATGLQKWLTAIPEEMWWLFGAGYLGYTGGRTFEKWRETKRR
jgi:preprotein translocase subunit SecY